jgi:hypothetical protein
MTRCQKENVMKSKEHMKTLFDCDDIGVCLLQSGKKLAARWIKMTQPVMLESFEDELNLDEHGKIQELQLNQEAN